MRRRTVIAALSAGCLLVAGVSPGVGLAQTDVTAPSLVTPKYASFVVGQQLSADSLTRVEELIHWKAADEVGGSGLSEIRVYEHFTEDNASQRKLLYRGLGSSVQVTGRPNFPYTCTSYLQRYFEVRAMDYAGNIRRNVVGGVPSIADQNGYQHLEGEDPPWWQVFTVSRVGTWDTSTFSGWIHGTTWKTRQMGASVSYQRSYLAGEHVGLVMAEGPDRGQADVYVDGKLRGTVDTYNPVRTHRILEFEMRMRAGSHTITIVNQATPGHSRIDIDALVHQTPGANC